jgi:hypothetical protein
MQFFSDKNVPAGKLIFDTAAHCEVGSSIVIFSIITKILLEILFNPNTQLSDGEIESICEKYII